MGSMFDKASNFNQPLNDWDVASVNNMEYMFFEASKFNQPLNDWNVASVTNMGDMFYDAYAFNQCLSTWAGKARSDVDVDNIFTYSGCPSYGPWCQGAREQCFAPSIADDCTLCTSSTVIAESDDFQAKVAACIDGTCPDNVPIGCWDTSKVTDMANAFLGKASFDDSINCWDVKRVTSMNAMFDNASDFNQPLNDWDVASVNTMAFMFFKASKFNQPLDDWNVASVNNMLGMFLDASNFNQPLDDWNVASVNDMVAMFLRATNFNQCLSTWADKTPPNVSIYDIFDDSGCPKKDPVATVGPWCQGADEQC